MKFSRLYLIKRFNLVSLVQSCWVLLALLITFGQSKADGLNDPTMPPESVIEPTSQAADSGLAWNLQGLKTEGKQGVAIVNGQWIAVGKEHDGYRLVSVTQTEAIFVNKLGSRKVLSLALKPYQTAPKAEKQKTSKSKSASTQIRIKN